MTAGCRRRVAVESQRVFDLVRLVVVPVELEQVASESRTNPLGGPWPGLDDLSVRSSSISGKSVKNQWRQARDRKRCILFTSVYPPSFRPSKIKMSKSSPSRSASGAVIRRAKGTPPPSSQKQIAVPSGKDGTNKTKGSSERSHSSSCIRRALEHGVGMRLFLGARIGSAPPQCSQWTLEHDQHASLLAARGADHGTPRARMFYKQPGVYWPPHEPIGASLRTSLLFLPHFVPSLARTLALPSLSHPSFAFFRFLALGVLRTALSVPRRMSVPSPPPARLSRTPSLLRRTGTVGAALPSLVWRMRSCPSYGRAFPEHIAAPPEVARMSDGYGAPPRGRFRRAACHACGKAQHVAARARRLSFLRSFHPPPHAPSLPSL
ncbi:hypothetical protein FB451DRAFT_1515635 [Mycena latifolia]|nr:hypothetical protein FB451DRAFT_1515635 [Mycena latifolia]